MNHRLESDFKDLEGFSERHTKEDLRLAAAAIALSHRDIDEYRALRDGDDHAED